MQNPMGMKNKVRKIEKPLVTRLELEKMEADAEKARELLEGEEFKFFRDYLISEKELIVSDFVNNRIHETVDVKKEIRPDKSEVEYHIKHTKEEQSAELSGRFKFIFDLINKLEQIKNLPEIYYKAEKEGKITIEAKKE